MDKKLKVGVFGARRGCGIAQGITLTEKAYISAVCDYDESTYENIKKYCCEETKFYTDFDEFINSGLDAVVLTNFFHQHAKYAVIALEKGIHVLSEVIFSFLSSEETKKAPSARKFSKEASSVFFQQGKSLIMPS